MGTNKRNLKIKMFYAVVVLIPFAVVFFIGNYAEIFFQQKIKFTILENQVAKKCVLPKSRLLSNLDERAGVRDPVPRGRGKNLHWCGAIITNYGSFILPTSSRFGLNLFSEPRERLAIRLKVGCELEAVITSTSGMPKHDEASMAPTRRKILRVLNVVDCENGHE